MEKNFELGTSDVVEAAYLWSHEGVDFKRQEAVRRSDGFLTVYFFFAGKTKEQFTGMRQEYYNRKARVEPKLFAQRLTDIRDILHNVLRAGRK